MNAEFVLRLAEQAVYITLMVSAPIVLIALVVGLVIGILQATTQIQEQTLAFVPKIIAVLVAILLFGPWMMNYMVDFTYLLLDNLHQYIG
jgi:flagellar biosynthetic protein FliQ